MKKLRSFSIKCALVMCAILVLAYIIIFIKFHETPILFNTEILARLGIKTYRKFLYLEPVFWCTMMFWITFSFAYFSQIKKHIPEAFEIKVLILSAIFGMGTGGTIILGINEFSLIRSIEIGIGSTLFIGSFFGLTEKDNRFDYIVGTIIASSIYETVAVLMYIIFSPTEEIDLMMYVPLFFFMFLIVNMMVVSFIPMIVAFFENIWGISKERIKEISRGERELSEKEGY